MFTRGLKGHMWPVRGGQHRPERELQDGVPLRQAARLLPLAWGPVSPQSWANIS